MTTRKQVLMLGLLVAMPFGSAQATPLDTELFDHAAALLMPLGLLATLLGLRNLRLMRHKRVYPARQPATIDSNRLGQR